MLSPGSLLTINNPLEKTWLSTRILPSPVTWSGRGHSSTDSDGEGRDGAPAQLWKHRSGACALPVRNHSLLATSVSFFPMTLIFQITRAEAKVFPKPNFR